MTTTAGFLNDPPRALIPFALACTLLGGLPAARAQDAADPAAARASLEQMITAYEKLTHYHDQGSLAIETALDGVASKQTQPLRFTLARPDRLFLDAGLVRLVASGGKLITILEPTKRHIERKAPSALHAWHVTEGPLGALVLGGPAGPIAEWVLHLVLDPADARRLLAESKHVQFDKPADLDGKPTIRILLARARGPALRFWLDPTTHLARRIELDFPPAAAPGENPNPEPKPDPSAPAPAPIQPPLAIAWSSGPIETGPIPDTSFAVEPPGDSIALAPPEPKPADRAGDADAAPRPKHALTDQPLPRFQVDAIRSEGKLAPLQSESLAGKVLVIDFWATWCPPCREELPELAKLAETYEKAGAPVWFLAISQDEKPDDGTLTDLVRGTLKELGAENPSLQVALDPESELGKRFEVEALPTLFLVDQKGSVRDVIVGYREGAIKSLREKIDALLKASPESRPGSRK